jgi:NodT family efflux transporter outer membrane factor (OMF) lipoprotein
VVLCVAAVLAPACAPKTTAYQRPQIAVPQQWDVPAPFRASQPSDAMPKGAWWSLFGDADLDALEQRASAANQTVQIAIAQHAQARALTSEALSALYPRIDASAPVGARRQGGDTAGVWSVPLSVSYEVDLFGRRTKSIEAAQAAFEASAADLENVRLIVAADLASDYLTLRRLDTEIDLLTRTVDVLQRALDVVRNRFTGGVASGLDVAQEEALLAATRTQTTLVQQQRDRFEHAIAVLVGEPAPAFHIAPRPLGLTVPGVALGVPTDLLERRPDVAEAERRVAVANARVGIARTAFFPSLVVSASGGVQASSLLKLFDVPSLVWAMGATAAQTLFDGGSRQAQLAFAQAGVDLAAADYRNTVLRALAEVQDALSGLAVINDALATQTQAVDASTRALDIANNRYVGGLVSALDLVSAQQTLLANQRLAAQLQGERLVTVVSLVKALGGGWDAARQP